MYILKIYILIYKQYYQMCKIKSTNQIIIFCYFVMRKTM